LAAAAFNNTASVQGTGFFTKDSNGCGIKNKAMETGGSIQHHSVACGRGRHYRYERNEQSYIGSTSARVQSNIHQISGSVMVKLPGFARIQPYALVGGGGLIFDPTDNAGSTFAGASSQARGGFLYEGGADYAFTRHLSLRAEYRGFVCKAPNFNLASLNTNAWTHIAQPSAGSLSVLAELVPHWRMSGATGPRLVRAQVRRGSRQTIRGASFLLIESRNKGAKPCG
jgi:opacity protein-like surface antigen